MSVDGEGSNKNKPQTQPASSQQLTHQDLNFSFNDILSNNHDVNDFSFQSIVQTLSNNNNGEHITPSYEHLPAELQDLFNTNETDDLLSVHRTDMQASQPFIAWPQTPNVPPVTPSTTAPSPSLSQTVTQQQTIHQEPQQQPSSTTLLDNITAQLPPERKGRFVQLFRELQNNSVCAADFLTQAKMLLGSQQFQQLEDLKQKSGQQPKSVPVKNTNTLKRAKTESIPQPSFHNLPPPLPQQQQQQQQQHVALPLQPTAQPLNITQPTPVFKTPAIPGNVSGLQIPTKTSATAVPPASTANTSSSGGGGGGSGGGDRIDYDTLTDVMGYAGVDLKEETEHFMKDGDGPGGILPDGVDRSKVQDFMNTDMLRTKIMKYAKCVDIKEIDGDFVSYVALATQDRIRTIMEAMVAASKYRTFDPFGKPPMSKEGHPLFKIQVKQNVKSQLEAIQHVERQSELDLDPVHHDEDEDRPQKKMKNRVSLEKGWYSNKAKHPLKTMEKRERKVTMQDAIFVMERDVQGGRGTSQRSLLKAYNKVGL